MQAVLYAGYYPLIVSAGCETEMVPPLTLEPAELHAS